MDRSARQRRGRHRLHPQPATTGGDETQTGAETKVSRAADGFRLIHSLWLTTVCCFCRKTGGNSSSLGDMVTGSWRTTPPSAGECKYYKSLLHPDRKNNSALCCPLSPVSVIDLFVFLFSQAKQKQKQVGVWCKLYGTLWDMCRSWEVLKAFYHSPC